MRLAGMALFTRRALAVALAFSLVQVPVAWAAPPDDQLETGVKQVEGGEFDAAVVTLDGVVRRLAASGREPKDLTRAYTYLGIAYLGLAQEQSAKARFLDALRADPSLKLDPGQFPPKVVQFFEQVRKDQPGAAAPGAVPTPTASAPPKPAATAAAAPATATPTPPAEPEKKGGSKALLILLGVGAAAGIGLAAAGGGGSDPAPPPTTIPAPTLSDLSATVTSPQQNSNIICTSNVFVTVTLTNRSRGAVSVTGVRTESSSRVGGCPGSPPFTYSPSTSSVGSNSSAAVLSRNLFTSASGCCNGACRNNFCELQRTFTVVTSLGELPAGAIGYGITFRNCPQCSSSVSASESGLDCPQAEQ